MTWSYWRWLAGPDFRSTGGFYRVSDSDDYQRWDPISRSWVHMPFPNSLSAAINFGDPTIEPAKPAEVAAFIGEAV